MNGERAHWGSRLGFILAASGSAVGLGNIWKFPYITGENGGGLFVIVYLLCIALIGMPIMMAEIYVGRAAQQSPVGAFRALSRPRSPWILTGWLGVAAAFVILSYYSVVAGWSMHYVMLSISSAFQGHDPDQIREIFAGRTGEGGELEQPGVLQNVGLNMFWHVAFMAITIGIVIAGVKGGIERAARVLMPLLILMLIILLVRATSMDGFGSSMSFVFGFHAEDFTAKGALEALGHAFFTLSLGMGAMITYGSYLRREDDLVTTSFAVGVLDTFVALLACMVLFPIVFSFGLAPDGGPGLVFMSMPIAFAQMTGGMIWATIFFTLLFFAALTSAISLLEVAASYFIDERRWSRLKATLVCGITILIVGLPSAMSGGLHLFGKGMENATGRNWFDWFDYLSSNWMLPLGGLFIALFVAWRVGDAAREQGFKTGTKLGNLYFGWLILLRYLVPIGVIAVFLNAVGFFKLFTSSAPTPTPSQQQIEDATNPDDSAAVLLRLAPQQPDDLIDLFGDDWRGT